jgi:hypothetical protein
MERSSLSVSVFVFVAASLKKASAKVSVRLLECGVLEFLRIDVAIAPTQP